MNTTVLEVFAKHLLHICRSHVSPISSSTLLGLSLCLPDPFVLEVYHIEKKAKTSNHKMQPEKQKQSQKQTNSNKNSNHKLQPEKQQQS